jgi:hypothetical protein
MDGRWMDEFSEAHLIQNVTQPQEGDDRIPIQRHDLQMWASLVSTIAFIGIRNSGYIHAVD